MCKNIFIKCSINGLCVIAIYMISVTTSEAGSGSGRVGNIYVHSGGTVMFSVDFHDNAPTCSSHEWAFNLQDIAGKAMYALLLTAKAQNLNVFVFGFHDCEVWPDRERPLFISLE